jgi:type IV pilus assembly protein PilV
MSMKKIPSRMPAMKRFQEGVMLIEALVAVLIFSLGIIAVLGMQSASILQVSQAKYRTDAAYLANQILGKMWIDRVDLTPYGTPFATGRASWDTQVAATLPNGSGAITVVYPPVPAGSPRAAAQVTVAVRWRAPDETANHQFVTYATIGSTLDGP